MNNQKKRIIGVILVLTLILGIALFFGNKKTDMSIANRKSKYLNIQSDNYGEWNSILYFTSNSSNVVIEDDNLTYSGNSDRLEDNEIVMHIDTTLYHDTANYPVENASMVYFMDVPSLFFQSIDQNDCDVDQDNGIVTCYDGDNEIGYIDFGTEMTYCDYLDSPTDCSIESDYHWYWDSQGIIIFNGTEISAVDSDYTVGINITFAFDSNYPLMEDSVDLPVYIEFDGQQFDYDQFTVNFEPVAGETIDLSNITAAEEVEYSSWQSEWGTESGTHDYYILYNVYGDFSYSNDYLLDFSLENNEGELLAYSADGINYENGNYGTYLQDRVCSVQGSGDTTVNCYMVLGFDVGDTDLETSVKITVAAGLPPRMTTKSFQFNHILKAIDNPDVPEYPSGVNKGFTEKNLTVESSEGAINKLLNGSSVSYTWLIEPTAVTINNGNKAFNLWELTNEGADPYTVSISSVGERLDSVYDGDGDFYELNGTDYSIVSFYPQKDAEYDYVLEGNSYVLTEVTNVSGYTPKQVYVKVNNEGFEPYGSYVKTSSGIVFTNLQGEQQNVSENNPIVLPPNTTEVKVSYTGTRAAVYLGINVSTTINGTDAVKNKINSLGADGFVNTVILKNIAKATFGDEESSKVAATYLSKLEVNSYSTTTSTKNGRIENNTADSITYVDKFYEQMNYTEENKNEVLNAITEQTKADVYELLPSGAELDGSVVVKTINENETCSFNPVIQDNYQGTGRVLISITNISCAEQNIKDTGTSIQTGYIVQFNIKYNNVAKQSYGTTLYKDAMFYGYQTLGNGYSSAAETPNGKFSSNSVKEIFDGLVTGNNNLLFTTKEDEVDPLSISIGTFSKTVSSESENNYSSETTVVEGTTYTYKLQYAFTSQLEEITNVIIIDKIEADYGDNENFKGYLDSIDTSYLESLGITPIIYYATSDVTTNTFNVVEWSTIKPSNVEDIVAIAIDCGSYRFAGNSGEAPLVYVKMVATQKVEDDVAAYNKASIVYKNVGDTTVKTLASEITKVNLNGASLKIDGTSNYGKGSQDDPAEIEEELIYTITVTNEDQVYTYKNVEVEVTIPDTLSAIDYTQTDGKVTLSIDSLAPGESKEFNIELMSNELPNGDKVFVGSYKIVRLNINPYESETGYIYNQILFPDLDIHKYVKTSDTQSFTDEADVIVKSEEEFSYRITVTNDADVAANGVVVVDTVPEGLNIVNSSIGNGTITDNTIKWTVNVAANSSVNIDYKVKLDSSAVLGTTYRSSANVTLYNPFDRRVVFYQEDTNEVSVLYQIVTNLKVTTTLDGPLADKTKDFAYNVTFTGSPSNAGTYTVINNKNEQLTSLTIDAEGNGTYSFTSKDGESITFKNLSGGITFNVEATEYPGYITSVKDIDSTQVYERNYCPGVTDQEGTMTCSFGHLYSASGIICLHNHPSGDVNPSRDDKSFTEALVEIGKVQKIPIIDHIIVSNDKYYSFLENGLIL